MHSVSPLVSPVSELSIPAVSARGVKAAREFEATLIASLFESMEKTFATVPGEDQLAGADDYNYMGTHALAEGIAARGGFGIARLLTPNLYPTQK